MQLSKLHIYSVGYAAENKKPSSMELEVYPAEVSGYAQGEVSAVQDTIEDSGEDAFGQLYSTKTDMSHSIKATWYSFGANRATAPDVRRGEQIVLFRFADVDKYYWMSTNQTEHLRRLETVIFRISNTRDEKVTKLDHTNTYYVEWSTHTKQITLVTTRSDGEPYAYIFQFDTGNGIVTLQDDIQNYFELNSGEHRLTLQNADKTRVVLDKLKVLIEAPEEVWVKTKAYKLDCDTVAVVAKTSITETTQNYTIKADQLQGTIIQSLFTGTVTVNGVVVMKGGISAPPAVGAGSGGIKAKIEIPVEFTKSFSTKEAPVHDGVGIGKAHKHTSAAPGSDTSAVNP